MRYRALFFMGSFLLALACSAGSTAPSKAVLTRNAVTAAVQEGDPCTDEDGRTGYFVRSGKKLICQT